MAELLFAKGILERFQNMELASGRVAMPTSPIPPERASGEILKKGTAVVTTLIRFVWAATENAHPISTVNAVSFKITFFMYNNCSD